MMRSKGFAVLVFLVLLSGAGKAQIVTIQEPATRFWGAIDFINPDQGVIGGERGYYAVTRNGGATWRVDSLGLASSIIKVKMLSADTIVVVAESAVAISADTGHSWVFSAIPYPSAGQEAFFVDSRQIWVSSKNYSGTLYHTRNRGISWDSVKVNPTSRTSFYGLYANASGQVVAAVGNFEMNRRSNAIYHSGDGGITWDSIAFDCSGTLSDFNQFFDLSFGTPNVGYAVGAKNIVYKTTDGGLSWLLLTQSDNSQPYLRSCFASGADTVFAFGDPGYGRSGMFSKNAGAFFGFLPSTWSDNLPSSANKRITAIWYGNGIGYAATGSGRVLKFTARSLGWVVGVNEREEASGFSLYPNPVMAGAPYKIMSDNASGQVEVSDATGRVVFKGATSPLHGLYAPAHPGMYTVKVSGIKSVAIYRLLVN